MNKRLITAVAVGLLFMGTYLLIRFRPGGLSSGQAGIAFVQNNDGSFREATEVRPAERTQPVSHTESEANAAEKPADATGHAELVDLDKKEKSKSAKPTSSGKSKPKGSEEPWLKEFELTERSGKLISSRTFLGQPYVVAFFYATCPSICVRQNEKFKLLQDKFKGQPIRLVEITCDPEVDRPEVLAQYANRFEADPEQWLFFTGDMDYISRVGSEMYEIGILRRGHPEKFALVDAQGKIYGYYTWSDAGQWQALQRDMAKLIAEQPK